MPAFAGMTTERLGTTVSCAARAGTTRHEGASPRLTDATGAGPCYPYSQCQTAKPLNAGLRGTRIQSQLSFPAALAAPRVSFILLPPPRGWRSADRRLFLVLVPRWLGRGAHLAIGALASRRSAVTVLGRASPALRFRHCRRHRREGLAAGALIEPRRRHPTSRTAVCRDATPAPSAGSSPETPLIERDMRVILQLRIVVNKYLRIEFEK